MMYSTQAFYFTLVADRCTPAATSTAHTTRRAGLDLRMLLARSSLSSVNEINWHSVKDHSKNRTNVAHIKRVRATKINTVNSSDLCSCSCGRHRCAKSKVGFRCDAWCQLQPLSRKASRRLSWQHDRMTWKRGVAKDMCTTRFTAATRSPHSGAPVCMRQGSTCAQQKPLKRK